MSPRARNPYQRFSHWFRSAIRRRLVTLSVAIVPRIYLAYMWFVFATSRIEDNNFADLHKFADDHDGAVALLWHEEVFTVAYGYYRFHFNAHTLASHGDVGRIITRMLELCDFTVFRGGSSSKKSRRDTGVVDDMIEHMQANRGVTYGITVDGSQGPAYRMKPGGVVIAQRCGKPVALVRTWYERSIRLNTWDRTAIPLPFNRIVYSIRGPYLPPEDATPESLEAFRQYLEDELIDLARDSYLEFGQTPPSNLIKRSESEASDPTQTGVAQ